MPLQVRIGRRVPGAMRGDLGRALSGHAPTSRRPSAVLVIGGSEHLTVTTELHVDVDAADREHVPYLSPRSFDLDQYALFAVGEWVDEVSLLLGGGAAPRVHAASFVDDERTWVVAGASNAGKTTLALDAVGRGATYLTDERITVRGRSDHAGVEISGLAQPLRIRGDLADRPESPAARFVGATGRDAFRELLFCDQFGSVERGWVAPTDLLVLHDEPPERTTRGWVVRQLLEQCQDAVRIGPEALVPLAQLANSTRVHVAAGRTLRSVTDVGSPVLDPATEPPTLLPPTTDQAPVGLRAGDGVRTLVVGRDECLIWLPGGRAAVIEVAGTAAQWWRSLVDGGPVAVDGEWAPFVAQLGALGAVAAPEDPPYRDPDGR